LMRLILTNETGEEMTMSNILDQFIQFNYTNISNIILRNFWPNMFVIGWKPETRLACLI
jgi:hypothetical protein